MGPLDALWHLLGFLAVPVGLGLLSSAGAKLLWRRDFGTTPWARLARDASLASALMATYGVMVAAAALTLWWRGFGPGRR
jgi:hypothetical protein